MPIRISCPSCGRTLRVPDGLVGEKIKCPACLTQFISGAETANDDDSAYTPVQEEPAPPIRSGRSSQTEYEDDEDDWDDDFRRRRRRRRRRNRDSASGQLLGPAIGLISTAILGLLLGLMCLLVGPLMLGDAQNPDERTDAIEVIVSAPIELITSLIVLIGAIAIFRMKNYQLAMAGSIVAMVPCLSPCCVFGIPFGIWGMVILSRPDIKRAFS